MKDAPESDPLQESILLGMHPNKIRLIAVVVPEDVQDPMQSVEQQLPKAIMSELSAAAFGFRQTDRDVRIDRLVGSGHRKGQDIRGRGIIHPTTMQQAHPTVIHDFQHTAMAGGSKLLQESLKTVVEERTFLLAELPGSIDDFKQLDLRSRFGLRRLGRLRRFPAGGVIF